MSKMILCKTCSKEIAKSAKVCPHCGARNKKGYLKKILGGIIIFFILIGVIASLGGKDGSGDKYEDIVKTGYLGNYKSVSLSKMMNGNFSNCKWETFESSNNKNIVQVNAEQTVGSKKSKMQIQFSVEKNNTFDVVNLKVDNKAVKEPYNVKLVIDTLYDEYSKKTQDNSAKADTNTNTDTLKGTPSDRYKK